MPDPKTEALLREFLLEDAKARGKGITLEALSAKVGRLDDRLGTALDDWLVDREENARYRRKTKAHEREIERISEVMDGPNWKPNPADDTGTHDLAVLKAQHNEDRADKMQWRQQFRGALLVACLSVLVGVSVGCITYVLARAPAPIIQPK